MSAAQAVLENSRHLEAIASPSISNEKVHDLIHELRQPLSSIEAIAYYLEMTLPAEQQETRHYMRRLQQLVDQTSSILGGFSEVRKSPGSEHGAGIP
jgi:signal transduction histidine kinase